MFAQKILHIEEDGCNIAIQDEIVKVLYLECNFAKFEHFVMYADIYWTTNAKQSENKLR